MPSVDRSGERFVIQKHQARTLHYDFRLEKNGVFKSWAVPKGVPEDVGTRRLAIQTDDHALEFGNFEGQIPPGEYGAGTVEIWDREPTRKSTGPTMKSQSFCAVSASQGNISL